MFFPIGDENVKGGSFPLFSYSFIAFNVVVFIFQASLEPAVLQQFVVAYGAVPSQITVGESWHTLISSMFLHGSWMHLIGNMVFLWVFADNIEATVGNVSFLLFYLLAGVVAAFSHIWFFWSSDVPMVGASGAISAVMGAYLVMYPRSSIKVLFLIFPFRVPAFLFLAFWIYEQSMAGFGSLGAQTAEATSVAWWAHIGGFVFGLVFGIWIRGKGKLQYDLH